MLALCATGASAEATLDRTVLAIAEPNRPAYKELDAREVKPPQQFKGESARRRTQRPLAEGCSAKVIAGRLDISPRTLEFHKYQVMEVLKLQSNAELVHFVIKHGIVAI